ncbi:hypothetical protein [Agreia sp. VKM Ac-1783]|uniref:hypothetical protein n=1 Tax=Agreia sp. VKM Ac-1783 TaxID=1938889 RepID=UPI000A2AB6CD|nr:hypothetical protein [Agreia sp. VKM Ac-1783]SMQ68372.1 hypothetical protein SAMN06295943_1796 [Agreia sp. VKM Ac-1783]
MTSPSLSWLPDRHLGVAATLAHADELIEQVGELSQQYLSQPELISFTNVPVGPNIRTTVKGVAPVPRRLALVVADALVTLRAAVEHTLYTEVEFLNGEALTARAARLIEMPASTSYGDFADWLKKRVKNGPDTLKSGSELVRRIESLQPFQRTVRPELHPMATLAAHTNNAKHRTPAVTAARLMGMIREGAIPRSISNLPGRSDGPIRVGEVITELPLGVVVPATLYPTVSINRPGTDEWPILMNELSEIASWVRNYAVPRLITGDDKVQNQLPAWYDIGGGHDDERAAISTGRHDTASERNKVRLGAITARDSLVEIVLPLDGAPTLSHLTAWLEQMSDDEVIQRVSTFKVGDSADMNLLQANWHAVMEMLREARVFAASRGSDGQ